MTDGDKAACEREILRRVILGAFQPHAGHARSVSEHLFQGVVQLQFDLAGGDFLMQLVDQDGLGLEFVTAVHQRHLAGNVGQVQRFFHGRVAAAHHTDFLAAVKEAIAGGAAGDAASHEGAFGFQPQVFGGSAGGDDQRVAGIATAVACERERTLAEVHLVDVVKNNFGLETLRMFQETLHQLRPLHAMHIGRPVVHIGGGHELATLRNTGDQHRAQVGARCVHGCGIAGRA